MKNYLENIISSTLNKYIEGEKFFDELDYSLRNDEKLIKMILEDIKEEYDYLIVSGHFGNNFKQYCKNKLNNISNKIILVNGGLRNDKKLDEFWKNYDIENKNIIFIDDTYYSGRTKEKIKSAIIKNNGNYIKTYVFYDGCKNKCDDVFSYYRYFDHFEG